MHGTDALHQYITVLSIEIGIAENKRIGKRGGGVLAESEREGDDSGFKIDTILEFELKESNSWR